MTDEIRIISTEEARSRILEGRHPEFVEHDDRVTNEIILELLEDGTIIAGIRESDGKLCFTRPGTATWREPPES